MNMGCRLYCIRAALTNDITLLTWFKMIFEDFATKKLAKRHFCVLDGLIHTRC